MPYRRRRTHTNRPADTSSGPHIVEVLENYGCTFFFRPGGSLVVRDLGNAPLPLREMFYQSDGAALVAYVRAKLRANNVAALAA